MLPGGSHRLEKGMVYTEPMTLRAFLDETRENAWDFPSAMGALGINPPPGMYPEDPGDLGTDFAMHPGEKEREFLRSLAPDQDWDTFDLNFDT